MPTTLEVDLESLAPPGHPDDFVRLEPRPVFKEHWSKEIRGDDGEVELESSYIGKEELERIRDRCNERILDTGDWCPIVINHTDDEGKTDPEVIGFLGPYKSGIHGNLKPKHAIFGTPWIYKNCYEKLKKYPRLSVEFWASASDPTDGFFDPCSLLGATTPELDLGVHYSKDESGIKRIRYSRVDTNLKYQATPAAPGGSNTFIAGGTNIDDRKKQTFAKDDAAMAGTLTPADLQQIVEAMVPVVQAEITKQLGASKADPAEPLNPGDDTAGEDIDGDGLADGLDDDLGDPGDLADDLDGDGLGDGLPGDGDIDDLGDVDGFDDDGDGLDADIDDDDGGEDFSADDADDEGGDDLAGDAGEIEIDDTLDAGDAGDDSDEDGPPGDGPSADDDNPPPEEGKKKMTKTPYAKLCEFEEAGDESGGRKFVASLDAAGKKSLVDEMDGDSDVGRVASVRKYMAAPVRGGGDETFTRQKYQKAVAERNEYRQRYQKEVAARRELQAKHDLLAERIEKSESEARKAVRYQKLSELPAQGYIFDLDEEAARVEPMTDEQFDDHVNLIVNHYQRVPVGGFLPTPKPQVITASGPLTEEKRARYSKQAAANVQAARSRGEKMEFKEEYERLLAADGKETAAV